MVKKYFSALIALICMCTSFGCSKNSKEDSAVSNQEETVSQNNGNNEISELIVPDENSEEYQLGSYRISPSGIKLYYDESIPDDLMLTLEKYFTSFETRDFSTYKTCLYDGYSDLMEEYLQKDFEYGLENSFNLQCDNLLGMSGADEYKITRIRAEHTENDDLSGFFDVLNDNFGRDYYKEVSESSDSLTDLYFSIIVQADDEEVLLISEFQIVFAEKDGKYYTFG